MYWEILPLYFGYKIISLVPSISETLYELGLNLIGITKYCIYPEELHGSNI